MSHWSQILSIFYPGKIDKLATTLKWKQVKKKYIYFQSGLKLLISVFCFQCCFYFFVIILVLHSCKKNFKCILEIDSFRSLRIILLKYGRYFLLWCFLFGWPSIVIFLSEYKTRVMKNKWKQHTAEIAYKISTKCKMELYNLRNYFCAKLSKHF